MKTTTAVTLFLGYFSLGSCFTKYGRSCKDIGCPSNQQCVMETDPCSYYQRQGECGSYPTCRKTDNAKRTCSNFVCPPSQVCQMDGDTPKCMNDHSKSSFVGYDTHNANAPLDSNHAPSAPAAPGGGNLYPTVPRGETTPRPNVNRAPAGGGGYQGGQVGSGYPGQARPAGYPGGYPQQGGYPQGGYPQGGYPQGGYQGNYPQQYPGYNGGYQQPTGYNNPYYQQRPQQNSGSSITDKITQSIKNIGTDLLTGYLSKAISGK